MSDKENTTDRKADDRSGEIDADTMVACPLPWAEQRRNLILFACCTAMQYFAAPVLYVGITQASLCNRLGADARTSNLPGTLFFAMTAMPALIAWLSPRVAELRRNLSLCYLASGLAMAAIAVTLLTEAPDSVKLALVILQGGVSGATMPTAIALLWEVIGRGSDESKRGLALSLAFGAGPILAVLGSLAQTALLGGSFFGIDLPGVRYPYGFVALFAGGVPVMAIAATLSWRFRVPDADVEKTREPISEVLGLLIGLPLLFGSVASVQAATLWGREPLRWLGYGAAAVAVVAFVHHFRSILSQRTLLLATIVTVLVYAGNMIPTNMNLYSSEALGDEPEKYAGLQNTLRFGFKVIAGAALGRLLMRTNPRAGLLATACVFLIAPLWAASFRGTWYLIAFGIFGAGELIGVYSPNYLVSASRKSDLRRNMAFMTMLMVPAAPFGFLYGAIVDWTRQHEISLGGSTPETTGYRLSFIVCALSIFAGIVLTLVKLPKNPRT